MNKTLKFSSDVGSRRTPIKNTGFHNLETKVLLLIFSHLTEMELLVCVCKVCCHWYNVSRNSKLWRELKFKGIQMFADRPETLTVCNMLWKCRNIEKLSLEDMKYPATIIRQMCRCNRSIKHIKIKNCRAGESENIPETVLRNILHSCKSLESLDLNGTQFFATRFYHELANLPNLRKLNLNNNKYLEAKDLITIALNCRNLEDVSVARPESFNSLRLSDNDAVFFFKNLSGTLKRVEFDTTGLTCPSFEAILSCPKLEKLSLRRALFLSGEIFRNHVSKLHGLEQLRLTHACQLVSEDFISLSKMHIFDNLNLFDISGCWLISDAGLRSVLKCCKNSLTYLGLKSCKSVKDLNFVTENCSKLQYLNIAHVCSCPDSTYVENLMSRIPKLNKLVVDAETLVDNNLILFHNRTPKFTFIKSVSEFHKDESPVSWKKDCD